MTIKEVEKQVGMTAKSIRLYESKGLIQIERDKNNSYRNFTEENVKQLKFIKIMRHLDFSIQEIKEFINADDSIIKAAVEKKLCEYSETEEIIKERRHLCDNFIKNYNKENMDEWIESNIEYIEYTESEEYTEIKNTLKEIEYEPISTIIFGTLMYLGPILWMIFNYIEQKYEALKYNIPLALVCTVFLTLMWKNYFARRAKNRKLQKKKNKGSWIWIPAVMVMLFVGFLLAVAIEFISRLIYEPENYLFFQVGDTTMWIILAAEIVIIFLSMDIIAKISKNDAWDIGIIKFIRKYRKYFIVVVIVALYVAITNITYVTEDEIIYHSWRYPKGNIYSYSDVKEINTGYKGGFLNQKGEFYYKVNFGDRWICFDTTTPNEKIEKYADTYAELNEFDAALMKYKPKKISSHKNEEYCDLDKKYIKLFGTIIDRIN